MRHETLAQSVYEQMRADLLTGAIEPGMPLRVEGMKQRYGASTSPLREAMFRLASEGFLLLSSQRGFRAGVLTKADLLDLAARRSEIETSALAISIEKGNEEWESEVVKRHHYFGLISRQVESGTKKMGTDWEQRHRALHLSLVEGCGSPWLLRFCFNVYDHFDRYRRVAKLERIQLASLSQEEDALVAAALKRDKAGATDILSAHIARTREMIQGKLFAAADTLPN
jgi:GntR family carbon starvation induced transcriptional regulator